MTPLLGFGMAGLAGATLGLVGGGGAMLLIPILVYGFGLPLALGATYSLFVLGIISLAGAGMSLRRRRVDASAALYFILPSFAGLTLARDLLLARMPHVLHLGGFALVRDQLLMALFGLIMIVAGALTWRGNAAGPAAEGASASPLRLALPGLAIGAMTGVLGAGGGFLIVPALILWARLPVEKAVGTSLAIVAANAWFGVLTRLDARIGWDWSFLLAFSAASLAGVLIGQSINRKLDGLHLRRASATISLILGLLILLREIAKGIP